MRAEMNVLSPNKVLQATVLALRARPAPERRRLARMSTY